MSNATLMRIVLFGTGLYYQNRKHLIAENKMIQMVAFLDNDEKKHGTLGDIPVVAPERIDAYDFDAVVIMSTYYSEMRAQLLELGVPALRIINYLALPTGHFDMHFQMKQLEQQLSAQKMARKSITVLLHELSITGSIVIAFHCMKIMIQQGYNPCVITSGNGPMYTILQEHGIPVFVDCNADLQGSITRQILVRSKIVLVNTVASYHYFECIPKNACTYWWIHEAQVSYTPTIQQFLLNREDLSAKIYAVSTVAKNNFLQFAPQNSIGIELLPFGIPDETRGNPLPAPKTDSICRILIVGSICALKGHDILLKAVHSICESTKHEIEIIAAGATYDDMFHKTIQRYTEICCVGTLPPQEMNRLYTQADIVVCCSREETMSAVIMEGLMHGKICILSSNVGISAYIQDGYNGLVYDDPEDTEALRDKILWVLHNEDKLPEMRKNARATYEQYFTMEKFEQRVKEAFDL